MEEGMGRDGEPIGELRSDGANRECERWRRESRRERRRMRMRILRWGDAEHEMRSCARMRMWM